MATAARRAVGRSRTGGPPFAVLVMIGHEAAELGKVRLLVIVAVGFHVAGRRVTVRVDHGVLHLLGPDRTVLRSRPNSLTPAELARIRDDDRRGSDHQLIAITAVMAAATRTVTAIIPSRSRDSTSSEDPAGDPAVAGTARISAAIRRIVRT